MSKLRFQNYQGFTASFGCKNYKSSG